MIGCLVACSGSSPTKNGRVRAAASQPRQHRTAADAALRIRPAPHAAPLGEATSTSIGLYAIGVYVPSIVHPVPQTYGADNGRRPGTCFCARSSNLPFLPRSAIRSTSTSGVFLFATHASAAALHSRGQTPLNTREPAAASLLWHRPLGCMQWCMQCTMRGGRLSRPPGLVHPLIVTLGQGANLTFDFDARSTARTPPA